MPLIDISSDYGYVILVTVSTFVMGTVHGFNTSKFRKAAKDVPYPIPYATAEQNAASPAHMGFSCAQRAHANYLENIPTTLPAMLISGLVYPRTAAGLGLAWTIGRYVYMKGYCDVKKGPKGRLPGFFVSQLTQLGLLIMTGVTGAQMLGWMKL